MLDDAKPKTHRRQSVKPRLSKRQARERYDKEIQHAKEERDNAPGDLAERIADIRQHAEDAIEDARRIYGDHVGDFHRAMKLAHERLKSRKPDPTREEMFEGYFKAIVKQGNYNVPLCKQIQKAAKKRGGK